MPAATPPITTIRIPLSIFPPLPAVFLNYAKPYHDVAQFLQFGPLQIHVGGPYRTHRHAEYAKRRFYHDGIGKPVERFEQIIVFKVSRNAFFPQALRSPGPRHHSHFFGDNIAADIGRAVAAYGQRGQQNGILGIIAAKYVEPVPALAFDLTSWATLGIASLSTTKFPHSLARNAMVSGSKFTPVRLGLL
jgi:hypothetical protein